MSLLIFFVSLFVFIHIFILVLILFQERIIFWSKKLTDNHTLKIDRPYHEHFYQPDEDTKIHSIYMLPEGQEIKGYIFYLHGTLANVEFQSQYAPFFLEKGLAIWIMDYRGYGKSRGHRNEMLLMEDVIGVYEQCKIVWQCNDKDIAIVGRSLGTVFASYLATKVPAKVCMLISPYYSIYDVPAHYFPWIPFHKMDKYEFPVYKYIEEIKIPFFCFQGMKDRIVPMASSSKLFPLLHQKQYFVYPHATHMNIIHDAHFIKDFTAKLSKYFPS